MAKSKAMKARWKPGFRGSQLAEPDKVNAAIQKWMDDNGGKLVVPDLVAYLKEHPRHILSRFVTWDVEEAAFKHWCEEIRGVVRSIEVIREEAGNEPVRQYHVDRSYRRDTPSAYTSLDDQMKDPELRAQLIQRALGELLAVRRKYHALQELAVVFRGIEELQTQLQP